MTNGNGGKTAIAEAPLTRDQSAEMAFLGSLILENEVIGEALEIVESSQMFAYPAHQAIFDVIVQLYQAGGNIDLVTLKAQLVSRNLFRTLGPDEPAQNAFLVKVATDVPNPAAFREYGEIVRDRFVLRRIIQACQQVIASAHSDPADSLRAHAERLLFTALAAADKRTAASMVDLINQVFDRIQDIRDRKQRLIGIATGFYELDDVLSGLQKGYLYIIAGRPSMGKTSLGMSIAERVALEEKKAVLFFSLEMAGSQIAQQMLSSQARVNAQKIRSGHVSGEDVQRLTLAAGAFNDAKILIDDSADLSALEMRTRAKRWKAAAGIDLIIVDYLQMMNARHGAGRPPESRQVEIAEISKSLKAMARELELPVVAMAQLNRAAEGREDRKPMLSDLRDSGAIEQDADAVLLLFRPEYYDPETADKGVCEVNIAKNRTGPTGNKKLVFLKEFTRFENASSAGALFK